MVRHILVALSLANLWFLRVWSELLHYSQGDTYLMTDPPRPVDYLAVMVNVVLAAAVFLALREAALRLLNKRTFRYARVAFVVSLIVPLNALREVLANVFPDYLKSPLLGSIGIRGVILVAIALGMIAITVVARYSVPVARGAIIVLVLLSPFCAVTFGQAIWRAARYNDTAFRSKPPAPFYANARKLPRVLWFICDEWDFRLTFLDRDPTLALPQIDRLREESLFAANAYPPATGTPESIPSYYTGRLITPVWYQGPRQLAIFYRADPHKTEWGQQPNVFEHARELGVNTALLEWFHPTCRVLDGLTLCKWWPMARQYNSMGEHFSEILPHQARSLVETNLFSPFGRALTADQHTGVYHAMLAETRKLVADTNYAFAVIHLPIPHGPFMFDRRTRTFTLGNSPIKGYLDHLALLDRTIGEIRSAMVDAGVWNSTTVVYTSDHRYRESESLDGKADMRIPFLLKLTSRKERLRYTEAFNTVLTGELLLAVMRGEITDAAGAAAWLDRNRARFPVP